MRKRYKEEQIIQILREAQTVENNLEICRKYGISQNTYYKWRKIYEGMEVSDIRQYRLIQSENTKLKRLVAEQALTIQAMKDLLEKKV